MPGGATRSSHRPPCQPRQAWHGALGLRGEQTHLSSDSGCPGASRGHGMVSALPLGAAVAEDGHAVVIGGPPPTESWAFTLGSWGVSPQSLSWLSGWTLLSRTPAPVPRHWDGAEPRARPGTTCLSATSSQGPGLPVVEAAVRTPAHLSPGTQGHETMEPRLRQAQGALCPVSCHIFWAAGLPAP